MSLERTGTAAEVAQAYLCATTNTFLTRQTLVIRGGLVCWLDPTDRRC